MKKSFVLAVLMLLSGIAAEAVPAYPAKRVVKTKNGKELVLTLRGDEHYSFFTDENSQPYRYANGDYIPISPDEVSTTWSEKMEKANAHRLSRARTRGVGKPAKNLTGKKKGIVILMEFQDQKFSNDNPKAIYQDFFNKEGYTEYGMTGSVKDYFKAQSYGEMEIDFDIAGPYQSFHTMSWYGAHYGNANDTNPAELMKEACQRANEDVNFADYDWDGDGEVEQIFVIYAGYGENYGASQDAIFPHEWAFSASGSTLTLDGVTLNTYACSCELRGTSGTELDGIGAACHEFSHCLGLPDFYDTSGGNFGMGNWDVMCSGNYNNESRTPAGYTAYERMFVGWITPVELSSMTRINGMKPLSESKEAYIIYNEANKNEYYLLENRQLTGFDASLSGHGLLVVHVDHDEEVWASNSVNVAAARQRMTIIPADGSANNYSLGGDPFPGTKGITMLTNYTTPAATLYNENTDGTKLMSKPIDNITEADGLISFVACRPEMGIPTFSKVEEQGNSFTVSWGAVEDAVEYELELTETPASKHDLEECLMLEEHFSKCYSKSAGLTDISNNMKNYVESGNSGWIGSKLYTSPNNLLIGTSKATGYVGTPVFQMPESTEVTVVIGGMPYGNESLAKGKLGFVTADGAEYTAFELTADKRLVFHLASRNPKFYITVEPESRMYLNYLAIYEGVFTEDELNVTNASRAKKVIRKANTQSFKTEQTSYTFNDLNVTSRYSYRIKAIGTETASQWGEEQQFTFSSTGIATMEAVPSQQNTHIYDLHGRMLGTDASRLGKGIYIIGGKKVVK